MADQFRIQLCGTLALEINGRRIDHQLPGRQGRLLVAYLVLHRLRLIRRDELIDALWSDRPPNAAETALSALLSKLRRLVPDGTLAGRGEAEDEVIALIRDHMRSDHPALLDQVSDSDLRGWIEET